MQNTGANELVKALHALTPLRVWSLIVTIFGDIVMQQGTDKNPAAIWSGAIQAILDLLDIDPGLTRTSLSRLVSNKLLLREKSGRNTFYTLSPASRTQFIQAAKIIYGAETRQPTGGFHLALLDQSDDRAAAREMLKACGYRFLSATTALLPAHHDQPAPACSDDIIQAMALPSQQLHKAAAGAWAIDQLNNDYKQFCELAARCPAGQQLQPADALAARTVLVHLYRRLVLRDPVLPPAALPADWAGSQARELFAACQARVFSASEQWLAENSIRSPQARPNS